MFLKSGIYELLKNNYKGEIPKLTKEQEKELSDYLERNLYETSKEIRAYIYSKYGIDFTPEGLVITLHSLYYLSRLYSSLHIY